LEEVKIYIDKNKKRPNSKDVDKRIKYLGTWVLNQTPHYNSDINESKKIMKEKEIHKLWTDTINDEKYKDILINDNIKLWKKIHESMKKYIDDKKKRPSSTDTDEDIKSLGMWICTQLKNYNHDIKNCKRIMETKEIYDLWTQTMNDIKYKKYLCDDVTSWKLYLDESKKFMNDKNKRPSEDSIDEHEKKVGCWISSQKSGYDTDISKCKGTLKNETVHLLWTETINDPEYKKYLVIDLMENWKQNLKNSKKYIIDNKKIPNKRNENKDIAFLGNWIGSQKLNYNSDINVSKFMLKNEEIHASWTATINDPKYREYLVIDLIENWKKNLKLLKKYIIDNKKNPSVKDVNEDVKSLSYWWSDQKKHYKKKQRLMKNKEIYDLWTEFINEPKPKPTKEKKQTPPPIKKNRKLKLVIIDDEPEEKEKSPIHHKTSAVGELHKTYRRMRSDTLHEKFKSEPQLWRDYHTIRNKNLASFDPASIPSNIIIRNLENDYMNLKRTKKVVDMGCGQAPIAHYFQNKTDKHQRFEFHNYDHQSGGDPMISEADISSLPLEDETIEIAIMSLALWGTSENCTQYIKEAYRVLEKGGGSRFYIIDCTNKWSTTPENAGQLLRTLLTSNGFDIIENKTDIGDKFCLFVCSKN
jgi:cyclopropane fatty-acyl-phospholipid synthase-like methyltransferase